MRLLDTHCHLDDPEFGDLKPIIERADLDAMVTIGTSLASSRRAAEIAERFANVYFAVGIHPHEADRERDAQELEELGRHAKCVAIGETGLDYYKAFSSRDNQKVLLHTHLELAAHLNKPLSFHCREAHDDLLKMLPHPCRGVMHCYSGPPDWVRTFVDAGLYISIAGPVTYPGAHRLREAIREIPLDRLVLETDAPVLTPQPFRGRRNEPSFIRCTAEKIADVLGMPLSEVCARTTANARALFGI